MFPRASSLAGIHALLSVIDAPRDSSNMSTSILPPSGLASVNFASSLTIILRRASFLGFPSSSFASSLWLKALAPVPVLSSTWSP